ncbi:TetR/AcrR family transcriptional regulator [Oryzifoliimicrobium ureilyticus]|uniref:TetR/AcrR family transcriptional regulator n=1 Tax=Oryzifoliimicrobium ureilyticus TaxID=3113724 RepID=UPI0030762439
MKAVKDHVIDAAKKPRGRPRTSTDEDKRKQIVETARQSFVELGYAGTTTDRVAAECKISKNTLYRLFPSKRELLCAVIATIRQTALDLPRPENEDLTPEQALEKIFLIEIDEEAERERKAIIHVFFSESVQYPEVFEMLHESAQEMRCDLAAWLSQQRERGKLSLVNPHHGARMLMDMIFGAFGPPQKDALDWPSRQARQEYMRECIAFFVKAAKP